MLAKFFLRYARASRLARADAKAGARAMRAAAALAPAEPSVIVELAERERAAGRAGAGEAMLRKAFEKNANNMELAAATGSYLSRNGNLTEAIELLQKAVGGGGSTDANIELSAALGAAGRYAEAARLVEAVLQKQRGDAELRGYFAFLQYKIGNIAEADRAFAAVFNEGNISDRVFAWRAKFFADQNNKPAAVETLRKGLEAHPRSSRLLGDYARFLAEQGAAKEAEEQLRKALRIDPGDTLALATLGSLLTRGNSNEGEVFLRHALAIDPAHEPSLSALLKCYDRDQRGADALLYLRRAVEEPAASPRVLCICGARLADDGFPQEAKKAFAEAVRRAPRDASVALAFADLLLNLNENEKAEHWYQTALSNAADDPRVIARVAAARLESGKTNEAEKLASQALSVDARCVEALGVRAGVLAARGSFEEALNLRKQTLQIEPENAAAHLDAADLMARLDRFEDARVELQIAARLSPNGRLMIDYAVALLGQGRAGFGIIVLSDFIKDGRGGARGRFVYAHLLASLGKPDEARAHLAAALEAADRTALDSGLLAAARSRTVAPIDPEFARLAGGNN